MSSLRLNLGSSDDKRDGWTSVDVAPPADVICDLRAPRWPWDDSSVAAILAKDIAEHIGNGYWLEKQWMCSSCGKLFHETVLNSSIAKRCPVCKEQFGISVNLPVQLLVNVNIKPYNGVIHFLNECHRVLKPGGVLELIVPCFPGIAVWCDPTHSAVYTQDLRYYVDERWNNPRDERGRFGEAYGITALFRTIGGDSGVDWNPISYARNAPDRRKLFLLLEAVK